MELETLNDIKENFQESLKIQLQLINFFDSNINDLTSCKKLIKSINDSQLTKNPHKLREFLQLLSYISINRNRNPTFLDKIEKILKPFQNEIKQLCSPETIFNIFKNNDQILFLIIEKNYFEISPPIIDILFNSNKYPHIINNFSLDHDSMQIKHKSNILLSKKKLMEGVNDNELCRMIQNDYSDDFVRMRFCLISDKKVQVNMEIPQSVYETHAFLKGKSPKMIEYAAFNGAVKIFTFLLNQKCEITPDLWIYAIYGRNKQILDKLKEKRLEPPGGSFKNCVIESIRAHNNQLAQYFMKTYLGDQNHQYAFEYLLASIDSYNYEMAAQQLALCKDFNLSSFLWHLSKNDYFILLSNLVTMESVDLNEKIVLSIFYNEISISFCIYGIFADFIHYTPLLIAVKNCHYQVVDLLINQMNIDYGLKTILVKFDL